MTARYWYTDNEGRTRAMEWRLMTDEDKPVPPEDEPEEAPDEPDEDIGLPVEDPKTDEVEA